jgi:GTP pyrophosphokinase
MTTRFNEALMGAAILHAGQRRKGTGTPYIGHLLGVAAIALEFGADEEEATAALLHDALEDAPADLGAEWVRRWIQVRFGPHVLEIVEGCTDTDERPKPPWRQRKEHYVRRIANEGAGTLLVSMSDKLQNARAVLTDFRSVGDAVFERFNPDAGKAGTIGYYRGLVNAFTARCRALAVPPSAGHHHLLRELDTVVSTLERETGTTGTWPLPG